MAKSGHNIVKRIYYICSETETQKQTARETESKRLGQTDRQTELTQLAPQAKLHANFRLRNARIRENEREREREMRNSVIIKQTQNVKRARSKETHSFAGLVKEENSVIQGLCFPVFLGGVLLCLQSPAAVNVAAAAEFSALHLLLSSTAVQTCC